MPFDPAIPVRHLSKIDKIVYPRAMKGHESDGYVNYLNGGNSFTDVY